MAIATLCKGQMLLPSVYHSHEFKVLVFFIAGGVAQLRILGCSDWVTWSMKVKQSCCHPETYLTRISCMWNLLQSLVCWSWIWSEQSYPCPLPVPRNQCRSTWIMQLRYFCWNLDITSGFCTDSTCKWPFLLLLVKSVMFLPVAVIYTTLFLIQLRADSVPSF